MIGQDPARKHPGESVPFWIKRASSRSGANLGGSLGWSICINTCKNGLQIQHLVNRLCGWWLVVGDWWLVVGGEWLVAGGEWLVAGVL